MCFIKSTGLLAIPDLLSTAVALANIASATCATICLGTSKIQGCGKGSGEHTVGLPGASQQLSSGWTSTILARPLNNCNAVGLLDLQGRSTAVV